MSCPVCGHPDGACTGDARMSERQIITSAGMVKEQGPVRMPAPKGLSRWAGRAQYRGESDGRVTRYDPDLPNLQLVQPEPVEDDDEADRGQFLPAAEEVGAASEPPANTAADAALPSFSRTKIVVDGTPKRRRKKADE